MRLEENNWNNLLEDRIFYLIFGRTLKVQESNCKVCQRFVRFDNREYRVMCMKQYKVAITIIGFLDLLI